MLIESANFVTSAAQPHQFLKRPIPHFVFSGRSNVGKSSLLNRLLNRRNIAKTSRTPGKTRLINYFLINDRFFFVDLPGYGYAQVSKKERADWSLLIESYLNQSPFLALILQLIDIRHPPSALDLQMIEWLNYYNKPFLILLTKADKLSKNQVTQQHRKIVETLAIPPSAAIPISSETALGLSQVWAHIDEHFDISKDQISKLKDSK